MPAHHTLRQTWRRPVLALLLGSLSIAACAQAKEAGMPPSKRPAQAAHLRLVDALDRPQDGYCLDILGSGPYIRFDMPMTAHNCKPGLYADEAVVWDADGKIRFPAYNVCATVAGIQQTVLPGAAVMPRQCDERSPFLEAQHLQRFIHRPDGRVELAGSGLCLSAGAESARTFDPDHRWRTLSMQRCEDVPLARSRWQLSAPKP
ncbi:hypothetical protein EII20_01545 [Comamonadaceae bacterium OH2545_COT-014]|nr:hypothetical protein EII20_01545 [Comamonadaceae bacterium OH2545_COT-014]